MARQDDKDALKVELGQRIQQAWLRAGYQSAKAFTDSAGVTDYNRFKRYERGENLPQAFELLKIARAAGTTVEWLLTGEADRGEAAGPAWDEFLKTSEGARISPAERRTLLSIRFDGLEPTAQAYAVLLAGLRMCKVL